MDDDRIRLVHNEDESRYELHVSDDLASVAEYRVAGDRAVFTHTRTEPRFRGRGLAARLVRWALDDVRARDVHVVARCWFVAQFIDEHPEYRELLSA